MTALGLGLAAPPLALWPFAGIALAPLILALHGRSARDRALLGATAGVLSALTTVVLPLGSALASFFDLSPLLSLSASFLVSGAFAAAGFTAFAVLGGGSAGLSSTQILQIASAWVTGDLLRSHLLTGLPWMLLGHFLAPVPELCQLAAIGGTALVSFWVAAVNACIASLLVAPRSRACWIRTTMCIAVGGISSFALTPTLEAGSPGSVGELRTEIERTGEATRATSLEIALVQPALPSRWRLDPLHLDQSLARLADLSARAGAVDLLIWPENAVPLFLPANQDRVIAPVLTGSIRPEHLLLGAPRFDREGARRFNSAFLYRVGGAVRTGAILVGVHDKVRRVPFTEYRPWPFRRNLGSSRAVQLDAGARPAVLEGTSFRLGPLVCYELLFSSLARSLVEDGAEILVNLSHDGYFGARAGAEQHMSAAILRAIEFRRPLLRATSDGLTVAIDAGGQVKGALPAGVPRVLRVSVVPSTRRSIYAHSGHLFAWLAAATAVAMTLFPFTRRRMRRV